MDLSLFLSIFSVVLVLITFVLNRIDKKEKDVKEGYKNNHQELIQYQLQELQEDVKQILAKLDVYDKETDKKIENAIDLHIKLYHKGEK